MKTYRQLSDLLHHLDNEVPCGSDNRVYYDPFPKHFDFDQDENPPPFYIVENMQDEMDVPNTAVLLGIGPFSVSLTIERCLLDFYAITPKKGDLPSNKN